MIRSMALVGVLLLLAGCAGQATRYTWSGDGRIPLQQASAYCIGEMNKSYAPVAAGKAPKLTLYKDCMEQQGFTKVGSDEVKLELVENTGRKRFGWRVGAELNAVQRNVNNLLYAAQQAKNRGDLNQAAQLFKTAMISGGSGVGNYDLAALAANGAPQIGALPGATGSRQAWGLSADFGPTVDAVNQYLAALYDALPAGEATPLGQHAFDWRVSDPQYAQFEQAVKDSLNANQNPGWWVTQGRLPQDVEDTIASFAGTPTLQDLYRSTIQSELTNRYWQNYYNSPAYRQSIPQL